MVGIYVLIRMDMGFRVVCKYILGHSCMHKNYRARTKLPVQVSPCDTVNTSARPKRHARTRTSIEPPHTYSLPMALLSSQLMWLFWG